MFARSFHKIVKIPIPMKRRFSDKCGIDEIKKDLNIAKYDIDTLNYLTYVNIFISLLTLITK
jgi:hypothetical protein